MRRVTLALIGFATLITFPESVEAQKKCPPRWHWNGSVCAPYASPPVAKPSARVPKYYEDQEPRPRYRGRYYGGAYRWQQCPRGMVPTGYGDCRRWHPTRGSECPPGKTLQGGRCKPYRGR
jgi:hypothetical protein